VMYWWSPDPDERFSTSDQQALMAEEPGQDVR
jgi:hypothetical protein